MRTLLHPRQAWANSLPLFLRRFLYDDDTAVRTRHRATNHQQIVFRIDARHCQPLDRHARIAHVTRRSHALDDPRRVSRSANRTRRAHVHRAMRFMPATEALTLDRACETAAVRFAVDDVVVP